MTKLLMSLLEDGDCDEYEWKDSFIKTRFLSVSDDELVVYTKDYTFKLMVQYPIVVVGYAGGKSRGKKDVVKFDEGLSSAEKKKVQREFERILRKEGL